MFHYPCLSSKPQGLYAIFMQRKGKLFFETILILPPLIVLFQVIPFPSLPRCNLRRPHRSSNQSKQAAGDLISYRADPAAELSSTLIIMQATIGCLSRLVSRSLVTGVVNNKDAQHGLESTKLVGKKKKKRNNWLPVINQSINSFLSR